MSGTIVLKQQHNQYLPVLICEACKSSNTVARQVPQWEYVSPTPDMETRGLTPSNLKGIVDDMNETMIADFHAHYRPVSTCLRCSPCILCLVVAIGVYILQRQISSSSCDPPYCDESDHTFNFWMIGFPAFTFQLMMCCLVCLGFRHSRSVQRAKEMALENMKQYVEVELNEQWQKSKLIRWTWTVESQRMPKGRVVRFYHIEVTSLLSQNTQFTHQPAHIVYVQAPPDQSLVQLLPRSQGKGPPPIYGQPMQYGVAPQYQSNVVQEGQQITNV